MIRVYFVFEDTADETGINLSFIDVPTQVPSKAIERVQDAASSGELWKKMYPDDEKTANEYCLLETKMMYLDISGLPQEHSIETLLPI